MTPKTPISASPRGPPRATAIRHRECPYSAEWLPGSVPGRAVVVAGDHYARHLWPVHFLGDDSDVTAGVWPAWVSTPPRVVPCWGHSVEVGGQHDRSYIGAIHGQAWMDVAVRFVRAHLRCRRRRPARGGGLRRDERVDRRRAYVVPDVRGHSHLPPHRLKSPVNSPGPQYRVGCRAMSMDPRMSSRVEGKCRGGAGRGELGTRDGVVLVEPRRRPRQPLTQPDPHPRSRCGRG